MTLPLYRIIRYNVNGICIIKSQKKIPELLVLAFLFIKLQKVPEQIVLAFFIYKFAKKNTRTIGIGVFYI